MKIVAIVSIVFVVLGMVVVFSSMPSSTGMDDDFWY